MSSETAIPSPSPPKGTLSSNSVGDRHRPKPFYIPNRGLPKQALIISTEVGHVVVAHSQTCGCGVQTLVQHQPPRLVQSQALQVLERTHVGDRLELVVQSRRAHAKFPGEAIDAQRLPDVPLEPVDGDRNAIRIATVRRKALQPPTRNFCKALPRYRVKRTWDENGVANRNAWHVRGPKRR